MVWLHILATFMIGLFTGALLTEGMILVPYWRRMDPAEFFDRHSEMGPQLFRFFAPLTTASVFLGVASAGLEFVGEQSAWRIAAGALCLSTLGIFFIYFRVANDKFADHSIRNEELGPELRRWAAWHWFRTFLMLIALACSIVAYV